MSLRVHLCAVAALAMLAAGCNSVGPLTGLSVGPGEDGAPAIASVRPSADGAAPEDTAITVTFNRPMSTSGFEVETEPQVALGEPKWSDDLKAVTVTPRAPLSAGILYNVRVRATDRLGAKMPSDYTWSFAALSAAELKGDGRPRFAERVEVGMDARVFTLFAAMLAATPEAPGGDSGAVRTGVRSKMSDLPSKTVEPVRRFMADEPASPEQYLASALSLSPPPEFREIAPAARPGSPSPGGAAATAGLQQGQTASQGAGRPPGGQAQATPQPTASPSPAPGASPSPSPTSSPSPRSAQSPGTSQPQGTPSSPGAPRSPVPGKDSLRDILAQFYADAGIGDLWKSHGKAYADALSAYQKDAVGVLGRATEYARVPTTPGGRITIMPNLLARPGQGYLVQQAGRAILIVASAGSIDRPALLRPFMRLLLAPARVQVADALQRAEPLYEQVRDVAAKNGYRAWPDVAFESLVEAATLRLTLTGDAVPAAQRSAYARGLVLVHHFGEKLADYERATVPLAEFYPTMVRSIDIEAELRRWAEQKPN